MVGESRVRFGAIALTATAGGMTLSVADGKDLVMGNSAASAYFRVNASATAVDEECLILNTKGTAGDCININALAGGVTVRSGTTSTGTDIESQKIFIVEEDTSAVGTTTYTWSVAAQSAVLFRASVACYNSTDNTSFSYVIEGQLQRDNANNTTLVNANTSNARGTLDGHSITVTAGTGTLELNLVSASTDNLAWRGRIEMNTNDTGLARTA